MHREHYGHNDFVSNVSEENSKRPVLFVVQSCAIVVLL